MISRPLLSAGMLVAAVSASGQALFTYDFTGSPTQNGEFNTITPPGPAHATVSPFTRTGVTFDPDADVFDSSNWPTAATADPGRYVGFNVTAHPGYLLDVASLSLSHYGSASGPGRWRYSIYLDGSPTPAYTSLEQQVFFSSIVTGTYGFPSAMANASSAEVRIYGYLAADTAGTWYVDGVSLNGTLSAVPEPGQYAWVFGLGLAAYAVAAARRTRRSGPVGE